MVKGEIGTTSPSGILAVMSSRKTLSPTLSRLTADSIAGVKELLLELIETIVPFL